MNFQNLFAEYYVQFRGDSQVPGVTDPEWAIGAQYGNTAIRRWAKVDAEVWDVLWTTAVAQSFVATWPGNSLNPITATFTCPANMSRPGGFIKMTDPVSGTFIMIDVVKLQDVQFQSQAGPYAYFTGGEQTGWKLTIVMAGTTNFGWIIDFPFYKKPTYFNTTLLPDGSGNVQETGTTVSECPDSSFIINYMLAYRFRATRNFPAYQTAKADAETALKGMQLKNGTGTPGDMMNLFDQNKSGRFGPNDFSGRAGGFGF